MKYKSLLIITFCFLSLALNAQNVERTRIIEKNIKTLRGKVNDDNFRLPIIKLGGEDVLDISFDELSHEIKSYSYTVQYCNADWTPSNISTSEYLNGFTTARIEDYKLSLSTTVLYTHYNFRLPNQLMNFKISGNYVVKIYPDNDIDQPVAEYCFSIVDPKVEINGNVRGNTDMELNGRFQQVDFDVLMRGFRYQDPQSEFKVVVRQNNRIDNQITDVKPTFINSDKLSFINNRKLIFEGGNEYKRFDISSVHNLSQKVNTVKFIGNNYQAFLFEDEVNPKAPYYQDLDVNGKFIINIQNYADDDITADYMFVNFYLKKDDLFLDGNVYIGGEYNYNQLNEISRMDYDFDNKIYFKSILLKQGGYNYQYWYNKCGTPQGYTAPVEGSHWQTLNEYTIYIYHRGFGERYDKLVGVKVL